MLSGDEMYDDEITSGPIQDEDLDDGDELNHEDGEDGNPSPPRRSPAR